MNERLWGLRSIGLVLFALTGFAVWYTLSGDRPRDFWQASTFGDRPNVFEQPGEWIDQDGRRLSLADYRGKNAVISFVFKDCQMTCPRIMHDLKQVDQRLEENEAEARFLVFLFDDIRNDPAEFKKFTDKYQVEGKHWRILTAAPETLRALAEQFKLVYDEQDRNQFKYIHTNFYAVIGPDGELRQEIRGIPQNQESFLAMVEDALQ